MANTTSILLVAFCESDLTQFNKILSNTGVQLKSEEETLDSITIGSHFSSWDAFSFSGRCIGPNRIKEIIEKFKAYNFDGSAQAVLFISDDDCEDLEGIYIHPNNKDVR